MRHFLTAVIFYVAQHASAQPEHLFRIVEQGKTGYINPDGKIVIQPQFRDGNGFSEGLAAVRTDGHYGFINTEGKFVLKPIYDYATFFVNGIARVYLDGKPMFIDAKGKVRLDKSIGSIRFINPKLAVVTTLSKNIGIIDLTTNRIVADTIYTSIGNFENGVAVAVKQDPLLNNARNTGVIDSLGNVIVQFGRFQEIQPFVDGYARVGMTDPLDPDGSLEGVIDAKGNLLFQRAYDGNYISEDFHDGLAVMYLQNRKSAEYDGDFYQGFIDLQGKIVLNDTLNDRLFSFSDGRTFISDPNDDYRLFDTHFNQVGTNTFSNILNHSFYNGLAVVETNRKWGIIDTSGNFVVQPVFDEIHVSGIRGDYFFYSTLEDDAKPNDGLNADTPEENQLYGIARIDGKIITQPILQEFDTDGFSNGLLSAVIAGRPAYINTAGKTIWQQKPIVQSAPELVNIDYMTRGYFYASSAPVKTDLGGFGGSRNQPKDLSGQDFPKNSLGLTVTVTPSTHAGSAFLGHQVYVSNLLASDVLFSAQDSRLYMLVQAKDTDGQWKDIEYLPSSWCGNSYHTLTLPPNKYWDFLTPAYDGEFKTVLRIKLHYQNPGTAKDPEKGESIVYSNEYPGGVNPAQFWNKGNYYPQGIMDPYND